MYNNKIFKKLFTLLLSLLLIITGFSVNPIVKGIDSIYDSPIITAVENITKDDPDSLWIAEAMGFPTPNYLVMGGAKTINATNEYPNLELWHKLDPEKKYEEIYNRYAHIIIEIVKDKNSIGEKFVKLTDDTIQVFITPEELETLNVKYIFTVRTDDDFKNENTINNLNFELIYNFNNYHIYKVTYLN